MFFFLAVKLLFESSGILHRPVQDDDYKDVQDDRNAYHGHVDQGKPVGKDLDHGGDQRDHRVDDQGDNNQLIQFFAVLDHNGQLD